MPQYSAPFVGTDKYVPFDDNTVQLTRNLRVILGTVHKEPSMLLTADKPWEARLDNGYPSVYHDPSEKPPFRLWYDSCIDVRSRNLCTEEDVKGLLYAESDNGRLWRKPDLGLVEWQGSRANNIALKGVHGMSVFRDSRKGSAAVKGGSATRFVAFGMIHERTTGKLPRRVKTEADREQLLRALQPFNVSTEHDDCNGLRLSKKLPGKNPKIEPKLLPGDVLKPHKVSDRRGTLKQPVRTLEQLRALRLPFTVRFTRPAVGGFLVSEDGLRWKAPHHNLLDLCNRWDTHNNAFWDARRKEYVVITRGRPENNRTVARASAPSLGSAFPSPHIIQTGSGDGDLIYSSLVVPYYSVYLGLISVYDGHTRSDRVRCELAWSSDSFHWHRLRSKKDTSIGLHPAVVPVTSVDAADFIPPDDPNSSFSCFYAKPIVVSGEAVAATRMGVGGGDRPEPEIWLYYMSGQGRHLGERNTTLRLARLRMDGFVGVTPSTSSKRGLLRTRPLPCRGTAPTVSATVLAGGSIRVGIDVVGQRLCRPGECSITKQASVRPLVSCRPITSNVTDEDVVWDAPEGLSWSQIPEICVLLMELRGPATLHTFGWPQ